MKRSKPTRARDVPVDNFNDPGHGKPKTQFEKSQNRPRDWMQSEQGTLLVAKQLGLASIAGESWQQFRTRILRELSRKVTS